MASKPLAARRSASQITWRQSWRSVQYLLTSSRHWHLEEVFNTSWPARDTGMLHVTEWQSSLEGCVWVGSDGFWHHLRPGGRSTSRSSTHYHKHSSIRSSLSHLWQNLRVRIRAPESSSFSPSVCFLASAASSSFIDGQQQASKQVMKSWEGREFGWWKEGIDSMERNDW